LRASEDETDSALAELVRESGLGWSVSVFVTRSIAAAALGVLIGALLGSGGLSFLLGLAGAISLPLIARRARDRRQTLCDQQMPQALELMALALRAGHPMPSALAIAASEAPSPIADELRRATDEHDLGRPLPDVLLALGKRLQRSEAVHTFVVAVLVLQQTGGNLIAVIDRIVENARARAQYRQRLKALTAEGRSSAKMMALIPGVFGVLATSMDPTYATTLVQPGGGRVVLVVCGALWLVGVLWTRSLLKAGT
jgi:tight adherence protein B